MSIAENVKFVAITVNEDQTLTVTPHNLKLEPHFQGTIIWQVTTSGWEVSSVEFRQPTPFDGSPVPNPDPAGTWHATTTNCATAETGEQLAVYTVCARNAAGLIRCKDPVVENEAPPGGAPTIVKKRSDPTRDTAQAAAIA